MDYEAGSGRLQHLGLRGTASFDAYDGEGAFRLLSGYLGADPSTWDQDMFSDPRQGDTDRWTFIRISPRSVVVRDFSYDAG